MDQGVDIIILQGSKMDMEIKLTAVFKGAEAIESPYT